jgi:hypothetical protein
MLLEAFTHDKKTDKFIWNDLVYYVRPYYMAPFDDVNNSSYPEQVVVPAGGTRTSYFRLEEDCIFMGSYMLAEVRGTLGPIARELLLNDLMVNIYNDVLHRPITARPCHVNTIFGCGRRPGVLPEPLWLDRNETLICTYTNNDAQTQRTIWPVIHGQRILNNRVHNKDLNDYVLARTLRSRQILPYFAPLDTDPNLDANEEIDYYYTQPADSHFEITKILYYSPEALNIELKIFDDSGDQLTYDWVHFDAITGIASRPILTYGPLLVRADTKWRFRIRQVGGGDDRSGYLTLAGRQLIME